MTKFRPAFDPVSARATPPVAAEPDRACAAAEPEVFFPLDNGALKAAIDICRTCPHVQPCLDWAIETRQNWGVWGATGPNERIAMIRDAS